MINSFPLAQAMLAADPALAAICGGCACRLHRLLPEIMTAVRTVARSRITSATPPKTYLAADGVERAISTKPAR